MISLYACRPADCSRIKTAGWPSRAWASATNTKNIASSHLARKRCAARAKRAGAQVASRSGRAMPIFACPKVNRQIIAGPEVVRQQSVDLNLRIVYQIQRFATVPGTRTVHGVRRSLGGGSCDGGSGIEFEAIRDHLSGSYRSSRSRWK